jgi:serine/threonine protein kinase
MADLRNLKSGTRIGDWKICPGLRQSTDQTALYSCRPVDHLPDNNKYLLKIFVQSEQWTTTHFAQLLDDRVAIATSLIEHAIEAAEHHILPPVDAGRFQRRSNQDFLYFEVYHHLHGGNLRDYVCTGKSGLPGSSWGDDNIEFVKRVMRQLTSALAYAHQNIGLHRDVKATNVVIDTSTPPRLYLTDFGLAKPIGVEASTFFSLGNDINPPEVHMRKQKFDRAGDYYQLGLLLTDLAFMARTSEGMAEALKKQNADFAGEFGENFLFRNKIVEGDLWSEVEILPEPLRILAISLLAHNPRDRWDAENILAYLDTGQAEPLDYYLLLEPIDPDPDEPFRTSRLFVRHALAQIRIGEPRWIFENFPPGQSVVGKWIKRHGFRDNRDDYVRAVESPMSALADAEYPSAETRAWEACFILDPHHPLPISEPVITSWRELVKALDLDSQWEGTSVVELINIAKRVPGESRGKLEIWLSGTQSAPAFQLKPFVDPHRQPAEISAANERLGRRLDAIQQWTDDHYDVLGETSSSFADRLIFYALLFSIRRNPNFIIRQVKGLLHWETLFTETPELRLNSTEDIGRWLLRDIELADEVRRAGVLGVWIDARQDSFPEEALKDLGLVSLMGIPVRDELLTLTLALEILSGKIAGVEVNVIEKASRNALAKLSSHERLYHWADTNLVAKILSQSKASASRQLLQRIKACLSAIDEWEGISPTTRVQSGAPLVYWILYYSLFPKDPIVLVDDSGQQKDILEPPALGRWMASNIQRGDELRMTGLLSIWLFAQHGFPQEIRGTPDTLWKVPYARAVPELALTTRMAALLIEGGVGLVLEIEIEIDSQSIKTIPVSLAPEDEMTILPLPSVELPQIPFRSSRMMTVRLRNRDSLGWMQGRLEVLNTEGAGFGYPLPKQETTDGAASSDRAPKHWLGTEPKRSKDGLAFSGNSYFVEVKLSGEAPRSYDVFTADLRVTYNHQGVREIVVLVPLRFVVVLDHAREWRNAAICAVCGALIFGYAGWLLETIYLRSAMSIDSGGELLPMAEDSGLVGMDGVSIWIGGWATGSTQNLQPTGPIAGPDGAPVSQYYQQGFLGVFFVVSFFVAIVLSLRWRRYRAPKAQSTQS